MRVANGGWITELLAVLRLRATPNQESCPLEVEREVLSELSRQFFLADEGSSSFK